MRSNFLVLIMLSVIICVVAGQNSVEARGKKKKIALFVYFADLVVKKIFILKLIYAFVFWVVLHKAGYFLAWFASYLKEQKKEHHHDHHPTYYDDHFDHQSRPAYIPYSRKSYKGKK